MIPPFVLWNFFLISPSNNLFSLLFWHRRSFDIIRFVTIYHKIFLTKKNIIYSKVIFIMSRFYILTTVSDQPKL